MSSDQNEKDRQLIARAKRGEALGLFEQKLLERAIERTEKVAAARARLELAPRPPRPPRRTTSEAVACANLFAEALKKVGGPRVKVWSKPSAGTRVYFPGDAGYLSVGQDGTLRELERGRLVFVIDALYPSWRKKVREAKTIYIAELRLRSGMIDA
jgi:hypothetical protein